MRGLPNSGTVNQPLPHSIATPVSESQSIATLDQTILKFIDRASLNALTQNLPQSESVLSVMQQLVEVIKTLRSLEQSWQSSTVDDLLPYVSEEAYEVLELLNTQSAQSTIAPADSLPFVRLDQLIPVLLWSIACSSYAIMQLLEGIPVTVQPAKQEQMLGILRLAVILEIQTLEADVRLDLAMGSVAQLAIDPTWVIQPDVNHPISVAWKLNQPTHKSYAELGSGVNPWLDQHLHHLPSQLLATQPALQPWLNGMAIEYLTPNRPWQTGKAQLRFEFVFMPHASYLQTSGYLEQPEIEAELLDETEQQAGASSASIPTGSVHVRATPITIVEMPLPSSISTTIVRLADAAQLDQFARFAINQELSRSLNWLHTTTSFPSQAALQVVVQEAVRIANLTYETASSNFCLLQPELFMDELMPKLLWHLTRSSFTGMQWLSGIAGNILQPESNWQTGTLRFMIMLELQTTEAQWLIDLATGRFMTGLSWQLPCGAIVQLDQPDLPTLLPIDQLQTRLYQHLQAAAPEIASLSRGVNVEWLTDEHEWQPGQLTIYPGLEFIANLV